MIIHPIATPPAKIINVKKTALHSPIFRLGIYLGLLLSKVSYGKQLSKNINLVYTKQRDLSRGLVCDKSRSP